MLPQGLWPDGLHDENRRQQWKVCHHNLHLGGRLGGGGEITDPWNDGGGVGVLMCRCLPVPVSASNVPRK